jgi:hypothetical protein
LNNLLETNAEKLRALHEAIKKTWVHRQFDKESFEAWKQACQEFHSSFDRLAFPGGLSRALTLLAEKDDEIIEQSVRFLEHDPFFFRSGYIKADILRHLRNCPLSEDQKRRLQEVIIAKIYDTARREFRWYCRLARHVTDREFESRIEELMVTNVPKMVARQAGWVLAQLRST